jgi:hypothetical protein
MTQGLEGAAHAVIKTYEESGMLQSSGNLFSQSFREMSMFEQPGRRASPHARSSSATILRGATRTSPALRAAPVPHSPNAVPVWRLLSRGTN